MEPVDDGSGAEEQEALEEGVGDHQEYRRLVGAASAGEDHVTELGHRRVGEHLLDVVLGAGDRRGHEGGGGADDGDHQCRVGRSVQERVDPAEEVDAGRDHRRCMDEGRHRGRALHRVGEPGEERYLRRLAGRPHEDEQADGGEIAGADAVDVGEDGRVVERVPTFAKVRKIAIRKPASPIRL